MEAKPEKCSGDFYTWRRQWQQVSGGHLHLPLLLRQQGPPVPPTLFVNFAGKQRKRGRRTSQAMVPKVLLGRNAQM